ncbi:MAG: T9SS type A sorting domain-containing protein [Bacteroidota bacterium]
MKKVKITLLAFMLLASCSLYAQINYDPFIEDPDEPIDAPGPKPFRSGSLGGPSSANCGDLAEFSFSPGFGVFCSSYTWSVIHPDGRTETLSGQTIDIALGSTPGVLILFAEAKSCTTPYNYNSGKTVDVGTFITRPSALNGPSFLCNSEARSYTASPAPGASNYTFTVPSGWKINGVTRTSLTINSRTVTITAPSSGRGTGQIRVRANKTNVCGSANSSYRTKTITYGRQYPVISPSSATVGRNSFVTLNASGIALSNYRWIIPNGWSAVTGLNSSELIAITGNTSGSFHVEVAALSCGINVGDYVNVTVTGGGGGFFGVAQDGELTDSETLNASNLTKEITIFPNPANDRLKLTMPNEGTKIVSISMVDVSNGKQVLNQKMNDNSSIDLSNVEDGIYILNIVTLSGERIQKRVEINH